MLKINKWQGECTWLISHYQTWYSINKQHVMQLYCVGFFFFEACWKSSLRLWRKQHCPHWPRLSLAPPRPLTQWRSPWEGLHPYYALQYFTWNELFLVWNSGIKARLTNLPIHVQYNDPQRCLYCILYVEYVYQGQWNFVFHEDIQSE